MESVKGWVLSEAGSGTNAYAQMVYEGNASVGDRGVEAVSQEEEERKQRYELRHACHIGWLCPETPLPHSNQ